MHARIAGELTRLAEELEAAGEVKALCHLQLAIDVLNGEPVGHVYSRDEFAELARVACSAEELERLLGVQ